MPKSISDLFIKNSYECHSDAILSSLCVMPHGKTRSTERKSTDFPRWFVSPLVFPLRDLIARLYTLRQ